MSAILSTDDLNDFISPGVACIKPIETLPAAPPPPSSEFLEHEVVLDGTPGATSSVDPSKPAQISLTDCLACSGCVTSAEAVLVSLQSHTEVLSVLDAAPALIVSKENSQTIKVDGRDNADSKILVASVAPQVLASLSAVLSVSMEGVSNILTRFLTQTLAEQGKHGNKFHYVVSTEPANDLSLYLSAQEVLSPSPSKPISLNSPNRVGKPVGDSITVEGAQRKPLLASSCPGWVCYAEKTHPYVLPHFSRVKSPQALTGVLIKSILSKKLGISPDRIWHLAIMPCFDKKLEAAREELTSLGWFDGHDIHAHRGFRDVDCVITSKEIFLLAQERGIEFGAISSTPAQPLTAPFPDAEMEKFLFPDKRKHARRRHFREAGSSGGILSYILHRSAMQSPGAKIVTTRGRNVDVVEYAVVSAEGEIILKAARYYGFRNIQNLVRRLKPARKSILPGAKAGGARRPGAKPPAGAAAGGMEYAYVEVMACPGGCTNGGGQVRVDDQIVVEKLGLGGDKKPGQQEQKAWLVLVDEAYFSGLDDSDHGGSGYDGYDDVVDGISPRYMETVLATWSELVGVDVDRLVHTSFREVISDVGKEVSEMERVVQLAGKIGGGW